MSGAMILTLRHTGFSDPEDFQVIDAGRAVGRIYATSGGFSGIRLVHLWQFAAWLR
jgi:hypothetical protein